MHAPRRRALYHRRDRRQRRARLTLKHDGMGVETPIRIVMLPRTTSGNVRARGVFCSNHQPGVDGASHIGAA